MNSKQRSAILQLIYLLLLLSGLAIVLLNRMEFTYLIAALILPLIITRLIGLAIPIKKKKKKTVKQKTRSNKKNNNQIPTTRLLSDQEIIKLPLEKMSGIEFERLCYLYYKAKGYKPRETKKGADGGVDLVIYQKKDRAYEAVQIKHYINSGNQITVKPIRELESAKKNHNCAIARFITTSTYTKPALVEADRTRIDTHDINWVENNIEKWRKEEVKRIS